MKYEWIKNKYGTNELFGDKDVHGLYLSYQPNKAGVHLAYGYCSIPETAICIDKKDSDPMKPYLTGTTYCILTGDHREQLAKLYPDKKKLLAYYKKHEDERSHWSND